MCVEHLFYMCAHTWFDTMYVFCFCTHSTHAWTRMLHVCDTHITPVPISQACDTCVPFKLWVICTICWLLNIYGGYLCVHDCCRPINNTRVNILLCPFNILLYHISNVFAQAISDIVHQENIVIAHTLL